VRQEFELTQEEFDMLLRASQPVPYLVIGSCEPPTPQEVANAAWQRIGAMRGFDWKTVKASARGSRFFTAVLLTPVTNSEEIKDTSDE